MQDPGQAAGPAEEAEDAHVRRQLQSDVHGVTDQGHAVPNEDGGRRRQQRQGEAREAATPQSALMRSLSFCCSQILQSSENSRGRPVAPLFDPRWEQPRCLLDPQLESGVFLFGVRMIVPRCPQ